jgi:hypothetical protein
MTPSPITITRERLAELETAAAERDELKAGWEQERNASDMLARERDSLRTQLASLERASGEAVALRRLAAEMRVYSHGRYQDWADRIEHAIATSPSPPRDAGREADARDAARYRELVTPEIHDFLKAVEREALHQRNRWGAEHDAGKTDADWFWLIGYLAGKAINKPEKLLHHVITTAAACLDWHAARVGAHTAMRPGIADPEAARALAGGGS